MNKTDYIPRKDKDFLAWFINLLKNLFPSLARFGVPPDVYQELAAKRDTFSNKLALADDPATRTKGVVKEKNDVRKDLKHTVRQFVKQYLANNPAVTNKDRDDMGLPIYKSGRTPAPVPAKKPDFTLEAAGGSRLDVHYHAHDEEQGTRNAKPFGVHGVEIAWAILDTPPTSYTDLVHSAFDTRSPYTFQFDLSDAGKRLYCCLRWENTRGIKGPWSEIVSAIIP
jgi:hypothetical protein